MSAPADQKPQAPAVEHEQAQFEPGHVVTREKHEELARKAAGQK